MLRFIERFHRGILLVVLVWIGFLFPLQIFADGHTELTTSVPSTIELEIVLKGQGSVTIDGKKIAHSTTISVDRLSEIPISVYSSNPSGSISVTLNGERLSLSTDNHQSTFKAPGLDGTLEVVFPQMTPNASGNPRTGDDFFAPAVLICAFSAITLLSLIGINIYKRRHQK